MASSPVTTNSSSPRMSQQSVASSAVFVINALEKIAVAREARRNKALKEAVDTALSKKIIYF
jgi:brefeldin A-inhibited guanine nucleotide-exchange protein